MTIKVPKTFPKYLETVREDIENRKTHKSISVRKETYEKLVQMGNMTTSFNDLITDLMNKANK